MPGSVQKRVDLGQEMPYDTNRFISNHFPIVRQPVGGRNEDAFA